MTLKATFGKLQRMQATIDVLLAKGLVKLVKDTPVKTAQWQLETLYQKLDCSIIFAYGGCENPQGSYVDFPVHRHPKSKEYLICVAGSVVVEFLGIGMRILKVGDCCEIPCDIAHSTRPLEENSKLLAVCIPYDQSFPALSTCESEDPHAA